MIDTTPSPCIAGKSDVTGPGPPDARSVPAPGTAFVLDGGFLDLQARTAPNPWKKRLKTAGTLVRAGANVGVGILNGVVGDYLHRQNNPLAVPMGFYVRGAALSLTPEALTGACPGMKSRLCVLVHGLACDETIWHYRESGQVNYGALLSRDLGYTPFYLRYNTGRHISENGRSLDRLMDELILALPVSIDEIVFITHSMGGLVTRSACDHALRRGAAWVGKVRKLFYLGSPHLGAPLEKFANAAAFALKKFPRPYIRIIGDVINARSSGIKDLRFGYAADADWAGHDPDALLKNTKNPLPLMTGAEHYVITGRLTNNPRHPVALWFGDALVRKPSALGRARRPSHFLDFPACHHREFPAMGHLKLTHSPDVYDQIRRWCES